MSSLISTVSVPGQGFAIGEKDTVLTALVACKRGDLMQLIMDSTGGYTTCTGSGANTITGTLATYTDSGTTLELTGAFANYTWKKGDRIRITAGAGVTAGYYLVTGKTSADVITIADAGADSTGDVSFTLFDNELMRGYFGVVQDREVAANAKVHLRLIGRTYLFTKNSADAAIAADNLFFPTSAKDADSGLASAGLNAKFVAKAIATAAVSTTATRALRLVNFNGIHGWGGTYTGVT